PVPTMSDCPECWSRTEAPATYPVPVIVSWTEAVFAAAVGEVELTVGPALTVKQREQDPCWPSGLVTVTSPAPVVADPVSVMLAVTCVVSTKLVELTETPLAENDATAPWAKFVPVIEMSWAAAPSPRELGEALVTVGA